MNNLLSYFGLFDARIRASNKDLPVMNCAVNFKIVGISAARLRSDDHDQYHFLRFEDQP